MATQTQSAFTAQLKKYYSFGSGVFVIFLVILAILEWMGMSNRWIGYMFLFATIGL